MIDRDIEQLIHSIDKRLAVIEERTEGLPKVRERAAVTSAIVALLISLLTAYLIHSEPLHAEKSSNSCPVIKSFR